MNEEQYETAIKALTPAPRYRISNRRHRTPLSKRLLNIIFIALALAVAPALITVLIGFGLMFGILFSWFFRGMTRA